MPLPLPSPPPSSSAACPCCCLSPSSCTCSAWPCCGSLINLGGFDTALLGVELTFLANPVYTTALFLLSWLLLTPFFEAGNFLLHTDIRTRQEGLDLQYRVQRVFASLRG